MFSRNSYVFATYRVSANMYIFQSSRSIFEQSWAANKKSGFNAKEYTGINLGVFRARPAILHVRCGLEIVSPVPGIECFVNVGLIRNCTVIGDSGCFGDLLVRIRAVSLAVLVQDRSKSPDNCSLI
jgi:hypothetical protein